MPEDLYIIHNAFSLLLSISLSSSSSNKSCIIFAHKKAKEIINSIQEDLTLSNTKIIPYSSITPPLQTILTKRYNTVFLSNPWHKRLIPFYLTIKRARKINLIDDGFATINENYQLDIKKDLSPLTHRLLKALNSKIVFDTNYSIFQKPSQSFTSAHNTNKCVLIIPNDILKAFTQNTNIEKHEKNIIIILGSTQFSAQLIKETLYPKNESNFKYLLKDHPNLVGGEDQLGCPPEFFLMRNMNSIKKILHCKSSTAYFTNYILPEIETEEYSHAQ